MGTRHRVGVEPIVLFFVIVFTSVIGRRFCLPARRRFANLTSGAGQHAIAGFRAAS
jgi:hypothetical protein